MRKYIITLAAVLCCAITMMVFNSCSKDEEEMKSELVGTWTEQNDLFTDVLILNEDDLFSFQSHIPNYNGSGNYAFEKKGTVTGLLILNYNNKEPRKLEILKLNGSTLEMSDRYGNTFHFRK